MTAQRGFQCPACGADFDVQERLDEEQEKQEEHAHGRRSAEPWTVTCPNCGNRVAVDRPTESEAPGS